MPSSIIKLVKNSQKGLKKYTKPVFLLVFMLIFSFPHSTESQEINLELVGPRPDQSIRAYYNGPTLPNIGPREARRTMYITVTAYNSEVAQTDDSPFITAFNTHVRDGIVATNFLRKGTIVRFPNLFGDKEFVVEDRMNDRYYHNMDIWMAEKADAVSFGVKFAKMEIL